MKTPPTRHISPIGLSAPRLSVHYTRVDRLVCGQSGVSSANSGERIPRALGNLDECDAEGSDANDETRLTAENVVREAT